VDWDRWIRASLVRLVLDSPENRLEDFDALPIFERPIVGVADGDDPLFLALREAVDERHLLPRQLLSERAGRKPAAVRVIVWALPFSQAVRQANRVSGMPSAVRERLVAALRSRGYAAVAPVLDERYDAFRSRRHTFASTWSERHVAFTAGLGKFGLNGSLITPLGSNVRLGSVVTDMPLAVTPRADDEYRAPCLLSGGETCGECIRRCPVGAISPAGLDKSKCYEMRQAVRTRFLEPYARRFQMLRAPVVKSGRRQAGYSLGCALCQCGVPCESRFPADVPTREAQGA